MADLPILWSFRRCPYAIRARMAIRASGLRVQVREILLRDKPAAFLAASPSATVPCLEGPFGVLDESRDIMFWALQRSDPLRWLDTDAQDQIALCDGPFKAALDHTKYAVRYPDLDPVEERAKATAILGNWDAILSEQSHLSGRRFGVVDAAILPFVRQFAGIDRDAFDATPLPALQRWFAKHVGAPVLTDVMTKYAPWQPGDAPVIFPAPLQSTG